jgi:hypothetical protein
MDFMVGGDLASLVKRGSLQFKQIYHILKNIVTGNCHRKNFQFQNQLVIFLYLHSLSFRFVFSLFTRKNSYSKLKTSKCNDR